MVCTASGMLWVQTDGDGGLSDEGTQHPGRSQKPCTGAACTPWPLGPAAMLVPPLPSWW